MRISAVLVFVGTVVGACSQSGSSSPSGSGGHAGTGGATGGSGGANSGGASTPGGSGGASGGSGGSTTTAAAGGTGAGGSPGTGGTVGATGGKATGGSGSGAGGSAVGSGSGGASETGGTAAGGATSSGGAGGGSTSSGGAGGSKIGGATSSGGAGGGSTSSGGAGGSKTGGGGGVGAAGGVPASSGGMPSTGGSTGNTYTCNTVLGIDSTSEWFTNGFENQVPDARWQIIYYHPGYVEDWSKSTDAVWSVAPTSACTANSNNPDRVIFNIFGDTADTAFTTSAAWVTGLSSAIDNMKTKWSNLKRVDLLTMTRAPNNQPCVSGNNMSIVATYVDDAVASVVTKYPGLVVAAPKFFAPSCDVFLTGGPHFTAAGKPVIAKLYGDYYTANP
jgi:hypothetical protein